MNSILFTILTGELTPEHKKIVSENEKLVRSEETNLTISTHTPEIIQ